LYHEHRHGDIVHDSTEHRYIVCLIGSTADVIRGTGASLCDEGIIEWNEGDVIVLPHQHCNVTHKSNHDSLGAALYYVHDGPLLHYLSTSPNGKRFHASHFPAEVLIDKVNQIKQQADAGSKNRVGILLGNEDTEKTLTLSHVLWALYNVVPPHADQKAHRHNAVALDLCTYIHPDDEGKVYTLIGNEVDTFGNIINGTKAYWRGGQAFTTPAGLWHSHHNHGTHEAWVLPIQDAGMALNQGIYDIRFAVQEAQRLKQGQTYKGIEY
jgi:gentisate 1,2-dioxygenase